MQKGNDIMKKVISLILVFVMMLLFAGCGNDKSDELDIKELVYRYEMLPCVNEIEGEISHFAAEGDAIYIYATKWPQATEVNEEPAGGYFYKCSADGDNLEKLAYEPEVGDVEWVNAMEVSATGELLLLYSRFDEVTMGNTYLLRTISADGEVVSEWDFGELLNIEDLFIQDMKKDRNGNIYLLSDQKIYIFDATGELMEQIEDDSLMTNIIRTKDGEILAGFDYEDGYTLKKIDADELAFCETYDTSIPYYSITGCIEGLEYDFYYTDSESLYGYDLEKAESVKKADWVSSNINSSSLGKICMLSENTMLATYGREASDDTYGLYFLKKVDPKDVKVRETITFCSLYPDEEVREQAIRFNKSQDEYQVVVRDYSSSEEPMVDMHKDLTAGEMADIVDLSGLCSDKYVSKEIFADLYEFMEADEEISKEDFMKNVLLAMETDGKLYRITPTFGINSLVTGASDVKMGEKFSVSDLCALEKNGAKAFYMDAKTTILSRAIELNYEEYVDWNRGSCNFEGESFLSVLEYADTYPAEEEMVWDEDTESMTNVVRGKKVLCASVYNLGMADVQLYEEMFKSDISVVGFPSEVFVGSALSMDREFAISDASKHKEGAWEFLKTYLSREYVSSLFTADEYLGNPIRKDSMEDKIRRYTATEAYTDDFGNEILPVSYEWGYEDIMMQMSPLSEQQAQLYRDAVMQTDHRYVYDSDVITMVTEEAQPYFDGQISAEEAAANIQERVSTYMEDYK